MARPEKTINWDLVEKKMQAGCSAREIYTELHINADTFYDRFKKEFDKGFSDYSDDFHSVGKGNVRFMQYEKAMEGNVPMLTLLGKFWLNQNDDNIIHINPAIQAGIDKDHIIMELQHENTILKSNGNKPQTE